jgi:hypothetical protein
MPRWADTLPPVRRSLVAVAVVAVVAALAGLGARTTYGARTSSDEPYYLLTALSLGEDLDLDLADELTAEQFRTFHELALNTQTFELNGAGQQLSPHDPLLPVLLAGPVRLGGWAGARATMALFAGLVAATTLWLAVRRFGVDLRVATLVVGSLAAAPPLVAYGQQIYPESPAALAVLVAVGAATGPLDRRGRWTLVVAAVALPWLSVKYVPVALVPVLHAGWRLARDRHRPGPVTIAAPLAAAGALYLYLHHRIYGGWTVYAAGDHFVDEGEISVIGFEPDYWGRSRRLVGLLVDRGFGLAAWTPAFLATVPAVVWMARRRPSGWACLLGTTAAGWATATWVAFTMHGWWWPGRQLVVVVPLVVVAIAHAVDGARRWVLPVVITAFWGVVSWLWIAVEASTGRRALIVDFEETANPLYRLWSPLLPDHHRLPAGTDLLTTVWAVLLIASGVLAWRAAGRPGSAGGDEDALGDEGPDADVVVGDLDRGRAVG